MSLRSDWESELETPQLLEIALIDRYKSAYETLPLAEWDAAIYIFGYVAEMILKTAYFRVVGNSLAAPVKPMLSPARSRGEELIPGVNHDSYHSLRFWSELLRAERSDQGRGLLTDTENSLIEHTNNLYDKWMVEMRYHPNKATEADALEVAEAVQWLFNNRIELGA